jgi:hypothetical protein
VRACADDSDIGNACADIDVDVDVDGVCTVGNGDIDIDIDIDDDDDDDTTVCDVRTDDAADDEPPTPFAPAKE